MPTTHGRSLIRNSGLQEIGERYLDQVVACRDVAGQMERIGVEISNGRLYAIRGDIGYLHWLDIHKRRG